MMSVTKQLKESIEGWANELRESPLRMLAQRGEITPRALCLYLESLRYMFQHTERNIALAASRCMELGLTDFAGYFECKMREENGHDGWAKNDLARLPEGVTSGIRPSAAVLKIIELQRELIAKHPICFVSYIVWAEYVTVLLGDEWLAALAANGYSRDQLSAVSKHVDADREHAQRGFFEFDTLWNEQLEAEALFETMRAASRLFEEFCDEICGEARSAA